MYGLADESIWDTSELAFTALVMAQNSFDAASYTSEEYGYSVAHPVEWIPDSEESYDYWAYDPSSSAFIAVQLESDEGYNSVLDYAVAGGLQAEIISQRLVYSGRPNPSYRIDYVFQDNSIQQKGAVLITLGSGNAVWVYVQSNEGDWAALESLASDIFLRVAVIP